MTGTNPEGQPMAGVHLSRRRSVVALPALFSIAVLAGCADRLPDQPDIKNTKEQVLAAYMQAVQAGDSACLLTLVNPRFTTGEADEVIARKLEAEGRRRWLHPIVRWQEGITPMDATATITASDQNDRKFIDTVGLVVIDDLWRVFL